MYSNSHALLDQFRLTLIHSDSFSKSINRVLFLPDTLCVHCAVQTAIYILKLHRLYSSFAVEVRVSSGARPCAICGE